jgi:hypothetical protein
LGFFSFVAQPEALLNDLKKKEKKRFEEIRVRPSDRNIDSTSFRKLFSHFETINIEEKKGEKYFFLSASICFC